MTAEGHALAEQLVREMFPHARAAWLGGSTVTGTATATSDLDITVLMTDPPAPYRESLHYNGWPVELFVQTEASLEHFCATELRERKPSTLRLLGRSVILLDTDGSAALWRDRARRQLDEGPPPLSNRELRSARYGITDLLDDLIGATDADERLMIAGVLWQSTADLLLTGNRRWTGSGKYRHRELAAFDRDHGTDHARELAHAVRSVAAGTVQPMVDTVTRALDLFGGRLFEGYRLEGPRRAH
ncbi:nucleotidyltransferase domain-containing protein [Nocardia transvalensis]|uniref:nucleotidyltransferase domain-containing protein n=1 Tax=Nocardia transvalensis TaxID=37333 RepID=UPI002B4B0D8E|nr:nucleotidyltransferase domain-containing protein [Nocardia transvalensis]